MHVWDEKLHPYGVTDEWYWVRIYLYFSVIMELLEQPRNKALFSTLLAEGRDPGECWSRGSKILGATWISVTRERRIHMLFG